MTPTLPAMILHRPQMGENIGAAARAMLNFGLTDLRIVAPRDGWPNPQADEMAAGAFDIIEVAVFESLPEALADLHVVYATTARERDLNKPVFSPRQAAENMHRKNAGLKTGFVFGCERTGLENDELALCHAIVSAPVNPEFGSLNLAQAVLLIAYECSALSSSPAPARAENLPADHETLNGFIDRLISELETSGFFKTETQRPTMERNIRAMLTRGDLTAQEVRTFHGMITALKGDKS